VVNATEVKGTVELYLYSLSEPGMTCSGDELYIFAPYSARYGVDGPVIKSRWGARFSAPVQTGSGAHRASYTWVNGSFSGAKRPGRSVDHLPPSSAEVKERVELYLGLRGLF